MTVSKRLISNLMVSNQPLMAHSMGGSSHKHFFKPIYLSIIKQVERLPIKSNGF